MAEDKDLKLVEKLLEKGEINLAYQQIKKIDQEDLYIKGEYEKLKNWYEQCINSQNSSDVLSNAQKGEALAKLGRVCFRMGENDLAKAYLEQSLKLNHKIKLFTLSVLGGVLSEMGDLEIAENVLKKVIRLAKKKENRQIELGSKVRLAKLVFEKNPKEAMAIVDEACVEAEKTERMWMRDSKIWKLASLGMRQKNGEKVSKEEVAGLMEYFEKSKDIKYLELAKTLYEEIR